MEQGYGFTYSTCVSNRFCGDGHCDQLERKHEAICKQDCAEFEGPINQNRDLKRTFLKVRPLWSRYPIRPPLVLMKIAVFLAGEVNKFWRLSFFFNCKSGSNCLYENNLDFCKTILINIFV